MDYSYYTDFPQIIIPKYPLDNYICSYGGCEEDPPPETNQGMSLKNYLSDRYSPKRFMEICKE